MRETVILVHGTFAEPTPGITQWYQKGSDFCRRLDEALSNEGSAARCWAHQPTEVLSWTGVNSWIDRTQASLRLRSELRWLSEQGWRCHVVGHSHGGNVVIEALSYANGELPSWFRGNAVILGTPIYERHEATRGPLDLKSATGILAVIFTAVLWGVLLAHSGSHAFADLIRFPAAHPLVLGSILVFLALTCWASVSARQGKIADGIISVPPLLFEPTRLLIMNSLEDEALNFLQAIHAAQTPWQKQPVSGTRQGLVPWFISTTSGSMAVDAVRYQGNSRGARITLDIVMLAVAVWLGAMSTRNSGSSLAVVVAIVLIGLIVTPSSAIFSFLLPWRLLLIIMRVAAAFAQRIGTAYVRQHGWEVVQRYALGLVGYPDALFHLSVSHKPTGANFGRWRFKPLNKKVQAEIVAARSLGYQAAAKVIGDLFDEKLWTADRVINELKTLARDTQLLHAAFYLYDPVISEIAGWLSTTEEDHDLEVRGDIWLDTFGEGGYMPMG